MQPIPILLSHVHCTPILAPKSRWAGPLLHPRPLSRPRWAPAPAAACPPELQQPAKEDMRYGEARGLFSHPRPPLIEPPPCFPDATPSRLLAIAAQTSPSECHQSFGGLDWRKKVPTSPRRPHHPGLVVPVRWTKRPNQTIHEEHI
jgi:hypothetical protein